MESAQELAGIDGVTVLELDVAQPASIAAWADRIKAAASHVDVSTLCPVPNPNPDHVDVRALCALVPDIARVKTTDQRAMPCSRLPSS